jgi:alanine-synthesizing transaminase
VLPTFDDAKFAMALLEEQHVLIVPGSSFNVDYRDHFRLVFLAEDETLHTVFTRIEALLTDWK